MTTKAGLLSGAAPSARRESGVRRHACRRFIGRGELLASAAWISPLIIAVSIVALGCTSQPDDDYQALSSACLSCLSEQRTEGCRETYQACTAEESCDDYMVCQLMGRCYERAPNSGCEQEIACERPSNAPPESDESSLDAAANGQLEAGALFEAGTRSEAGTPARPVSPRELATDFESCARTTCARTCGFIQP